MMIPVPAGPAPKVTYFARADAGTTLRVELRVSSKPQNHTPDTLLATREIPLAGGAGFQPVALDFSTGAPAAGESSAAGPDNPQSALHIPRSQYAFYIVHANPAVEVALSDRRVTGILALTHEANKAVAKSAVQTPPDGAGVDAFEFWLPRRRPAGENLACKIEPPVALYGAQNLVNGLARPVSAPNAWAAAGEDRAPAVTLRWAAPQAVRRIVLAFDTDYDHPMESVQMGHPESDMPFCVSSYRILDASGKVLVEETGNHLSRREHVLAAPVTTTALRVELSHPSPRIPAALFAVRVYAE
jgi:hypothetical protein